MSRKEETKPVNSLGLHVAVSRIAMGKQRIRAMTLTVAWDCGRQTYTVLDEDGVVLSQSPDHSQAVALAIKDARTLRLIGVRASVFSKRANGKLRHEWTDTMIPDGFPTPAKLARPPR
jgi:hypothetical protein